MDLKTIEFMDWNTDKVAEYRKSMPTIFQYNPDIDKNAYMNWRMDRRNSRRQFVVIGEAYFSTAHNLVQQCLIYNTDKKADLWIFPILFNIVHGIEVYLKAINASLKCVLKKDRTAIEGGHDIRQLCCVSKKLLLEYKKSNKCGTTNEMYSAIEVIENFIANIYKKTNDMTFARYPMAKDKNDHFYVQAFENEVVDLEILNQQIVIVYKLLDFIFEMPELDMDIQAEAMANCY